MALKPKASLFMAYEWICDNCGRHNFVSAMAMDMSTEDNEKALRKAFGIQDFEEIPEECGGEYVTQPNNVTCSHCNEQYEVESWESPDDE